MCCESRERISLDVFLAQNNKLLHAEQFLQQHPEADKPQKIVMTKHETWSNKKINK